MTSATGNLLHAQAEALVNTVNCVGIMGKGLALQFKQAFPQMYEAYRAACAAGEVQPGRMHLYETGASTPPRYIINFPTKRHWRAPSRMEDIDAGLVDLVQQVARLGLRSVAIPPLGSGNGGLDWSQVRPRIVAAFTALPDVEVLLYEPRAEPVGPERRPAPERPALTATRAAFLRLLDLYRVTEAPLSLLEVQKLAYFLQLAGQPLRLEFIPHKYGPYAHNLNHVLRSLEGHYLHGATDVKPTTRLRLAAGAREAAEAVLAGDEEAPGRLARVAALIEGWETPYGMELLATTHWAASHHGAAREDVSACVAEVYAWPENAERKRSLLKDYHIEMAWSHLRGLGWFSSPLPPPTSP